MSNTLHDLKISEIKKETKDCVSITFEIPENLKNEFSFISGQYLTLQRRIDGEDVRRAYSLCSAPFEGIHKVAIKQIKDGVFSTFANNLLSKEDTLQVMSPMGSFIIDTQSDISKNYVFYAAGSGITPIISMIKSILFSKQESKITLFYGNKESSTIIFKDDLEKLQSTYSDRIKIVYIFSKEKREDALNEGRINKEKNKKLISTYLNNQTIDSVYLCGPESMIFDIKESMIENGVNKENIHFELFTTSSAKDTKNENTDNTFQSTITIELDGESVDFEMNSSESNILDMAHDEGIDVPFACKGGVCCTCKAKITIGEVSMDVNYALEEDEVEEGYILTCQSHPKTKEVSISFDE